MSGNRESSAVAGSWFYGQSGWGRPRPQSQHVHSRAVGQAHSTWEAIEQRSFNWQLAGRGLAEMVEGRGLTKGNLI